MIANDGQRAARAAGTMVTVAAMLALAAIVQAATGTTPAPTAPVPAASPSAGKTAPASAAVPVPAATTPTTAIAPAPATAAAPKPTAASTAAQPAKKHTAKHGTKHSSAMAVTAQPDSSAADSSTATRSDNGSMELKAGQESTVFRTLTVEGEDRIHIDVARPDLDLALDPASAPGLEWGSPLDALERTTPDPLNPLLDRTARDNCAWVARPWLSHFPSGPLARVQPDLKDVANWKLTFVDQRGHTVASFSGNGRPPDEIDWNGRTTDGGSAMPGVTYSYVLEAHDRAGNKRNFVGQGFQTTSLRVDGPAGPTLLFTGAELAGYPEAHTDAAPPIVLEAATLLNRGPAPVCGVRINVTARSQDQAAALSARMMNWLAPLLAGDPTRLKSGTQVSPDAPESGSIALVATR